jgi:hypothetical protein
MDKLFGDYLVKLWEEHHERGETDPSWKSDPVRFTHRLDEAARQMFGDLAPLLTWTVGIRCVDQLEAWAGIPAYSTDLVWVPDITGLYRFHARTRDADGFVSCHLLDGRLKLGAILSQEDKGDV